MKNSDYWRQRFMMLEDAAHSESVEYTKTLEREFAKAQRSLQSDIEKWYARFAKNNEISYSEARKMLNADQLKEFRWTVQDYIKAGESLDPAWAKQLENASARVHISRLEALQLQLRQQAEVLFGNQVDGMDGLLRKVYSDGYYHTAFEIQRGFNLGWDLQSLDPKQLDTMLSKPWTLDGKTFSDRIWTNKTDLINTLHTQLTQGIIRGDGPDKAIDAISNRFKVSKNRANALVMTESAYFSAVAQKDCFNSLDVEKFEVVSTLDGRTCETCGDLDGMVFPMSQYEPGVTANPFHTSCRCCTAPHFDDDYGERVARNAEGEVYYVPSNIKFEDWKKGAVYESKEAYKKNSKIDYASSKQISKKTTKEVSSAVNTFKKDFPDALKTVDSISFGSTDGELGVTAFSLKSDGSFTHTITLNSDAFANEEKLLNSLKLDYQDGISYNTNSINSLVAHELGHVANNALALKMVGFDGLRLTPNQITDFSKIKTEIAKDIYLELFSDESFEEIQRILAKDLGKKVLNPSELIAQCFGNYYYGEEKSKLAKKVVQYFKRRL